eukprot:768135-Hanusia_phi.AAC.6
MRSPTSKALDWAAAPSGVIPIISVPSSASPDASTPSHPPFLLLCPSSSPQLPSPLSSSRLPSCPPDHSLSSGCNGPSVVLGLDRLEKLEESTRSVSAGAGGDAGSYLSRSVPPRWRASPPSATSASRPCQQTDENSAKHRAQCFGRARREHGRLWREGVLPVLVRRISAKI